MILCALEDTVKRFVPDAQRRSVWLALLGVHRAAVLASRRCVLIPEPPPPPSHPRGHAGGRARYRRAPEPRDRSSSPPERSAAVLHRGPRDLARPRGTPRARRV